MPTNLYPLRVQSFSLFSARPFISPRRILCQLFRTVTWIRTLTAVRISRRSYQKNSGGLRPR